MAKRTGMAGSYVWTVEETAYETTVQPKRDVYGPVCSPTDGRYNATQRYSLTYDPSPVLCNGVMIQAGDPIPVVHDDDDISILPLEFEKAIDVFRCKPKADEVPAEPINLILPLP